ncbi:MAG TPA: hypothetical protein VGN64_01860 [Dyadobacter sp.]|jgi:hypothetical protein|nr:hypothetical protein [Dyadobacter sp.]
MKKHPIDDIFKKKLEGIERKPSAAAWERMKPAKEEKRLPLFVWYMAAGITVTLLAGYMIWMSEAGNVGVELVTKTSPPAQVEKPIIDPSVNADSMSAMKIDLIATSAKIPVKSRPDQETEKSSETKVIQPMVANLEPVTRKETQAIDTSMEPVYPEIEPIREVADATPAVQNEVESRTIVVNVTEPKAEVEQEKSSRLGKIFRQLKNVKHGESVDWKEIGFNPKEVVARVDGRLRDGEEKVSEKYQNLKERTKF